MRLHAHDPHTSRLRPLLLLFAALLASSAAGTRTFAQTLFPDILTSNPTDSETNVGRQKGRKGLLFRFKFFNASMTEDDSAFPLVMTTATVTLKVGAAPAMSCTPGINPAAGACQFAVVAGEDDPALDTVEIFFNGDFPASTIVQFSVAGAHTTSPNVAQSADPNVVTFTTGSGTLRDPVALELVFDISGSMSLPAAPGGAVSRMDALKNASNAFFMMLNDYSMLGDKVGVVYFSDTATVFDPVPGGSNLTAAHDPTASGAGAVAANIQTQNPTFSTSIGDGLRRANTADGFSTDPAPTKRVFLFSDGEQNTAPNASVSGTNLNILNDGGTTIMTYPAAISVCPVTAGRLTAPGNALQQDIANAKCGGNNAVVGAAAQTFTAGELNTYFTQTLASVLVGDKVEHVRNVTGKLVPGTNATEKFFANSNDVALSILLSWHTDNKDFMPRFLPFRLLAPDGSEVDVSHLTQVRPGTSFTTLHFPLRRNNTPVPHKGEWTVELIAPPSDPAGSPQRGTLDYQVIVMLDNANLASEYHTAGQDHGTGEPIPIQVSLKENGAALKGATVVAQLLGPENGVGNILSTSGMPSGNPNVSGDVIRSEAQKKLLLLLNDPASASLFASKSLPSLVLLDNGQAANGDAAADDGVYSGLFNGALQEGHYYFLVNVRGTTPANGDFQRTQVLTVFVRPKPVASETVLAALSRAPQPDGSVVVRLSATPRDRFRNRIGPDYLGHLDIRSSEGTVATPLADKLDGSYEISYRLPSASSNPDITVSVLGTDVLTKPLDQLGNNVQDFPRYGLSLHAGSTFPHGTLNTFFDPGLSLAADFEYRFTNLFSVEAYLGHDRFKSSFFSDDFWFTHISGHAKFTFGTGAVRPSLHAGLGAYFTDSGGAHFGGNVGGSLQFWLNPHFAVEPSYNYRAVRLGGGTTLKYSTLQGGVRFRF